VLVGFGGILFGLPVSVLMSSPERLPPSESRTFAELFRGTRDAMHKRKRNAPDYRRMDGVDGLSQPTATLSELLRLEDDLPVQTESVVNPTDDSVSIGANSAQRAGECKNGVLRMSIRMSQLVDTFQAQRVLARAPARPAGQQWTAALPPIVQTEYKTMLLCLTAVLDRQHPDNALSVAHRRTFHRRIHLR